MKLWRTHGILQPLVPHAARISQLLCVWQALDDVNRIAAAFIALQRSVQQSSFEAVCQLCHVRPCLILRDVCAHKQMILIVAASCLLAMFEDMHVRFWVYIGMHAWTGH